MPPFSNFTQLNIQDAHDIASCATLASLLEVSAYPKPGNVHRTHDFPGTRFEHFLAAGVAIYPALLEAAQVTIEGKYPNDRQNLLGETILKATRRTHDWQGGGNVNFGEILLFAPLVIGAAICINEGDLSINHLHRAASEACANGTVLDGIMVYQAFQVANPGSMRSRERYDVTNPRAIEEIRQDQMTFRDVFLLDEGADDIAAELTKNFPRTFEEGIPHLAQELRASKNSNTAIVDTFLFLLGNKPDSFIARKAGAERAQEVQIRAKEVLTCGGMLAKCGEAAVWALDEKLQKEKGQLNPGTTADIIGATLFVACLCGLRP